VRKGARLSGFGARPQYPRSVERRHTSNALPISRSQTCQSVGAVESRRRRPAAARRIKRLRLLRWGGKGSGRVEVGRRRGVLCSQSGAAVSDSAFSAPLHNYAARFGIPYPNAELGRAIRHNLELAPPESAAMILSAFHGRAEGRSNKGMNRTRLQLGPHPSARMPDTLCARRLSPALGFFLEGYI
jgi:hypothetical protein